MSNGFAGIANVEIENGSVTFAEVWGAYSPGRDAIELTIRYMVQPGGDGNVHHPPKEVIQAVYLSEEELFVLADQLSEWAARAKASYEERHDHPLELSKVRIDGEPAVRTEGEVER